VTSIHGIGGALPGPGHGGLERKPDAAEQPAPSSGRRDDVEIAGSVSRAGGAEGVDPDLWAMLSRDERAFYLRNAMSGPLTYGPGSEPNASASPRSRLGGRIDVRG